MDVYFFYFILMLPYNVLRRFYFFVCWMNFLVWENGIKFSKISINCLGEKIKMKKIQKIFWIGDRAKKIWKIKNIGKWKKFTHTVKCFKNINTGTISKTISNYKLQKFIKL